MIANARNVTFGPGWAIVGDAGCHKDPFQGLGICSAFRDADFLASAVHEGLIGQTPLDEALMTYERRRNDATMAEYRENIAWARFSPMPAEILQLRQAVRGNQHDTYRFIMTLEGVIPREQLFSPENLERIRSKSQSALALG